MVRNKDKTKITFSPPPHFPRLSFSPLFLNLQPLSHQSPKWHRILRNGGCSQFITFCHSFFSTAPCCGVGSLPWDIVPVKLFQCGSSTQAVALQKLYQHGASLWGGLQEWTAPAWAPPWAALPSPLWALHRLQLPSEHICLLWHGLQCGYPHCLLWGVPHGLWGHNLLSSWAAPESLLQHLECLLTVLLH